MLAVWFSSVIYWVHGVDVAFLVEGMTLQPAAVSSDNTPLLQSSHRKWQTWQRFLQDPLVPFFILHSPLPSYHPRQTAPSSHMVSPQPHGMFWKKGDCGWGPWLGTAFLAHWYSINASTNWRNLFYVVTIWLTWKGLPKSPRSGVSPQGSWNSKDLPVEFNESVNLDGK